MRGGNRAGAFAFRADAQGEEGRNACGFAQLRRVNLAERIDELHRNGYKIIQNPEYFCFGCDAVLLTGFANVKAGETLMDLGTGCGIIPILLEAKTRGSFFAGLEIQEEMAGLARRSVELNSLSGKIRIDLGDIKNIKENYKASSFDVVTSNPPYMNNGGGLKNAFSPKAIARHEVLLTLDDVIKGACHLLKTGGRFYMIHKPHRLVEIITTLKKYNLEPKVLRQVQPFAEKPPEMILIQAVKGARSMVKVENVLVIYEKPGVYTPEVMRIYGM